MLSALPRTGHVRKRGNCTYLDACRGVARWELLIVIGKVREERRGEERRGERSLLPLKGC